MVANTARRKENDMLHSMEHRCVLIWVQKWNNIGMRCYPRCHAILFLALVCAAASLSARAATVAGAQAFMDKAEAELLELGNEGSRAGWIQETYITLDT